MRQTSALYKELLAAYQAGQPNVKYETRLAVGETGVLITERGDTIIFGTGKDSCSILVAASGGDGGYGESLLVNMEADFQIFADESPTVGNCISSEIDVEMIMPAAELPRQARLVPYVRLTDGKRHSEWLQKGVFYIDTRGTKEDGSGIEKILIHGYDDMLKAEQDYPASKLQWPARDIDVVREIAEFIGVDIDPRTAPIINRGYLVEYPTGYSCRDVLGYIAAMYAGCFVMSDIGELRLVTFYSIPKETRYLIDNTGYAITFGVGPENEVVRILV